MKAAALLIALLLGTAARADVAIPYHGDPRSVVEAPTGPLPASLRIVTDDEFPPLHFADADGRPTGFSVDLMRAVCERLGVPCTIQARRFDTLLAALAEGQADVAAAAFLPGAPLKARFDVSAPYHRLTARFLALSAMAPASADAALERDGFAGRRVAVVRDSAHAAMLGAHFPRAVPVGATDIEAALALLQRGEAELLFGDGQTLALWLGSRAGSAGRFVGGPYLDPRYLGEGIGFVMRREDPNLKRGIDHALRQLWVDGTYARLFLRYFPVSPF